MASFLAYRRTLLSTPSTTSRFLIIHPFRALSTTSRRAADDKYDNKQASIPFANSPAPYRLPKEEQEIFEKLQRESTGAFSTPKVNQSPNSEGDAQVQASENKSEGLHRDFNPGLKPEFEGEKNPKTGEIGGPKNEPLRWGAEGDWSYGGRVTDF